MQTKKQATPTIVANSKESSERKAKQRYTFINVRVKEATKVAMNKIAKDRKLSLSKAVEHLIEREVSVDQEQPDLTRPRMWIGTAGVDPTITLTPDEIEAYEKPQLISAGKPVVPEPWFVRLLNRLFGR